jgi:hypothetical protein
MSIRQARPRAIAGSRKFLLLALALATTGAVQAVDPKAAAQGGASLVWYPDLAAFLAAGPANELEFEDFHEGEASSTSPCHEPITAGFGAPATSFLAPTCFAPGDFVEGFSIRTNTDWNPGMGGGGSDWGPGGGPGMFFAGAGSGNGGVSNVVGAFSGTASTTLIDFSDQPVAISMDVYDVLAGSPLTVEVYAGAGQLIGSSTFVPVGDPHLPQFAGFTSPVPVQQVRVRSASGASQMVGNLRFGGKPGGLVIDAGAQLAFGSQAIGSTTQRDLVLRNEGDTDLQLGVLEAPPAPFAFADDACSGNVLAPAASCIVAVTFAPTFERRHAVALAIASDDPQMPQQSVSLSGYGVVPGLTIVSGEVDFGVVPVGGSSAAQLVTLANITAVPVSITAIGEVAAPFAATSGDCPAIPFELAPGETCTLGFAFAPEADGVFDLRVPIASSDPTGPALLLLHGTTSDVIFADGFEQ